MTGFIHYKNFFSLIPKEMHTRIYNELPSMSILFPYEISASDISHVQLQYYSIIRPIPYGIITFMYFSKCMNQWVAVEVNRFHKISTVWSVITEMSPNSIIYIGIHVFKENNPPLFVEIRTHGCLEIMSGIMKWPYEWTYPPELPIDTLVCDQILDITCQTPFPIYHFQYFTRDPTIPDTIIRVRDVIDSDVIVQGTTQKEKGPAFAEYQFVDGQVELFRVRAGSDWDTFYLYALDGKELVYYAPMYIQNLEQSLLWNALFRSVQRPDSYDWIEKCEKEPRKKNQPGRKCTVDNYRRIDMDLVKTAKCRYHAKFGHWIPIEAMPGTCRPIQIAKIKTGS